MGEFFYLVMQRGNWIICVGVGYISYHSIEHCIILVLAVNECFYCQSADKQNVFEDCARDSIRQVYS